MKQQIHPAAIAVCILVVVGVVIFLGMHAFRPTTAGGAPTAAAPPKEQVINGQPVPSNVPSYYWKEHQGGQPTPGSPGPR
jgi:hypothetical protein